MSIWFAIWKRTIWHVYFGSILILPKNNLTKKQSKLSWKNVVLHCTFGEIDFFNQWWISLIHRNVEQMSRHGPHFSGLKKFPDISSIFWIFSISNWKLESILVNNTHLHWKNSRTFPVFFPVYPVFFECFVFQTENLYLFQQIIHSWFKYH